MTDAPKQHTVENGVLTAVSPSQIQQFIECPTLWYFNKVQRIKVDSTIEQDVGIEMHSQMENLFINKVVPKHPSCVAAMNLSDVPPLNYRVYVEEPSDYGTGLLMANVPVKAKVDLRWIDADTVHVRDWKSCKNYSYNKTSDELARNPQGVIYMTYGFKEHPAANFATFGHVYLKKTGGYGAKAVVTDRLSRSHVGEVYSELENVVAEMKQTAMLSKPEDARYNKSRCGAFGGCPMKSICPVWTKAKVTGGVDMDALLGIEPLLVPGQGKVNGIPVPDGNKPLSLKDLISAHKKGEVIKPVPSATTQAKRFGPQDPHLPKPFELVTELVTDSFINPPDAREPYEVKPWYPEDKI
jgi:hypothetical protein